MGSKVAMGVLSFALPGGSLRMEGLVLLVLSVLLYWQNGGSWVLFALLSSAPDLSVLGYLAGGRVGVAVYDVFHTHPLPAALAAYGLLGGSSVAVSVALIWFAHIGMDRMVGYGLKYSSGFKETHLQRL